MSTELQNLSKEISQLLHKLPLADHRARLQAIEKELQSPDVWADNERMTRLQQEQKSLQNLISQTNYISSTITHLEELEALQQEASTTDSEMEALYQETLEDLQQRVRSLKIITQLNGKYDRKNALLSLSVGQGGTDAQDWTAMLLRMYSKFAASRDWKVTVLDQQHGEEAGITSALLEVQGPYAYGYLKQEQGIHRLVRISPFSAGKTRETSFAAVEVTPQIDDEPVSIEVNENDLEMKSYRASGPGGQYTNKTSTAVQLIHKPTGLSVRCSTYRSQAQNRTAAYNILLAKLQQLADHEREAELAKLKGDKQVATWGQQTRSYVLHPYKLVKDSRSGISSTQVDRVLDGDLEIFMQ